MTFGQIMDSEYVTSATKGRVSRALGLNGMAPLAQADQDAAKARAAAEHQRGLDCLAILERTERRMGRVSA